MKSPSLPMSIPSSPSRAWKHALARPLAALALLLAAIGIYGVLAFAMAQRTSELGVRMAIGANARAVLRLVIGDGMRLCVIGVVIGLLGALAVGRLMRAQLYEVGATDPLVLLAVTGVLVAVALAACAIPAVRATRISPTQALRNE